MGAYHKALHRNAYAIATQNNPQLQVKALGASWQAFEIALSDSAMKPAIGMLNDVTAGLNDLAVVTRKYPTGAKYALEGMAVGVTALGAAATAVFAASVIGKVATGIALVGRAAAGAAGGVSALEGVVARLAVATGTAGLIGPAAVALAVMKPARTESQAADDAVHHGLAIFHQPLPATSALTTVTAPPHDGPVEVNVVNHVNSRITNPRDIATGVTSHIVDQSRRPQGGYSGLDIRSDPFAAGLQAGVP